MASYYADDGNDVKRKKQPELTNCGTSSANKMKQSKSGQMIKSSGYAGALTPKESTPREGKEVLVYLRFWTWSSLSCPFDLVLFWQKQSVMMLFILLRAG
jgi:hypothetical protein